MTRLRVALLSLPACLAIAACASESHRTLDAHQVDAAATTYQGPRLPLVVGKVKNSSTYMNGLFAGERDQLGSQSKTILKNHLAATNRFQLADRDSLEETGQEAQIGGSQQQLVAADFVVTGEVTEFGRKEVGDKQLFGILGRGKQQTAYAKVSVQVVDTHSSMVVHAVQGVAEYSLDNREVLGTGSTAAYDSTLNGKVLDLAFVDAVNKLVRGLESGSWGTKAKQ